METQIKKRRGVTDMTEGSILRHLILFALPLFLGNLFQLLYNTVDTWVVGNYVSDEAFSAVGTLSAPLNMMIGGMIGITNGGSVVISQYFGAKQYENVNKAVHTMFVSAAILGVSMSVIGVAVSEPVLHLMNVPEAVMPEALLYLRILYGFMFFPVIYNCGAAILRAVGDSKKPFLFLVVSCLTNIVLDLLFVIKFNMGVAGVGYATVIAQTLSMVLVLIVLFRTDTCVKLDLKKLRIDAGMLKRIVNIGIPAAIQAMITSFSNVFVQRYINSFGASAMGGWSAYNKIDQVLNLPIQSLSMSLSTFVAQNLGRAQEKRAKEGVRKGLIMSLSMVGVLAAIVVVLAEPLVRFFNSNEQIVYYGVYFLRHISPMYLFICAYNMWAGALRGSGNGKAPMAAMLISGVAFRQLYLFTMSRLFPGDILPITYGYPAGWVLCSLILGIYYYKTSLLKDRVVEEDCC